MKKHIALALITALLNVPISAEPSMPSGPAAGQTQAASAFAYERHVLDNGLTVLLYKDSSMPLVAVNIWYKIGSKNESPGKTGFAHLFEHYMFECTKHIEEGQYFKTIFKDLGGTTNATTSYDRTDYFAVVPSNGLDEILRLESSRMGYLQECLREDLLNKERDIVKNEKRMRESRPYGKLFGELMGGTFSQGHPYHWPVIGYMKDLEAATVQDVKDFHSTYYLPNNAVMVVAGDIEPAAALDRVKFWFEEIKKGPTPPALNAPKVASLGGRREGSFEDAKAQLPMLIMSFPIPGAGEPGNSEMSVVAQVLGDGRTSRLEKALKDGPQPMALDIGASVVGLHENDVFYITAIPTPGVTLAQLEAKINAEIAAIARDGVTPREMDRIKAGMEFSVLNELQNVENVAMQMVEGEALAGDPELFLSKSLEELNNMKPDAVKAAAQKFLVPENTAVLHALPKRRTP